MPINLILLTAVGSSTIFTAVFFGGWSMLRAQRRQGKHRMAYHGWFVWLWMLIGVSVGPPVGVAIWGVMSWLMSMFGLLGGWLVGMIHGAVMLRHFKEPPETPPHDPLRGERE